MSTHEYRDVVEQSIRLLAARSESQQLDLRSICWTLYSFQRRFDREFTQAPVLDWLIRWRYLYVFNISQHPDYMKYKDFFDNITTPFAWVLTHPLKPHSEQNPAIGYIWHGKLYCEAGSALWHNFVLMGLMDNIDSKPPILLDLAEVVAHIAAVAEKQREIRLIRMWYPLLATGLFHYEFEKGDLLDIDPPPNEHALRRHPAIQRLRDITRRTRALHIPLSIGKTTIPTAEAIQDYAESGELGEQNVAFLRWWFNL